MGGKHTVTVHGALGGQKVYVQWGAAWFPICIRHCYNYPIATQPSAR